MVNVIFLKGGFSMASKKFLVFTATYNESDNIQSLINEIFNYMPHTDILVVDDNSPDGTHEKVLEQSKSNKKIHLIKRPDKNGLGTAHLLAKKYALTNGYDYLITMDADFSHHPKYLPNFEKLMSDNDFVIGSRYIKGGFCEYGLIRTFISKGANYLNRILLGFKTFETTTSYRGFSRSTLEKIVQTRIDSNGYSYFIEIMFILKNLKNIGEFPIYFEDRREGTTKISSIEILNGFKTLIKLFFKRLFRLKTQKVSIHEHFKCSHCNNCYCSEITLSKNEEKYINEENSNSQNKTVLRCLFCNLVQKKEISIKDKNYFSQSLT